MKHISMTQTLSRALILVFSSISFFGCNESSAELSSGKSEFLPPVTSAATGGPGGVIDTSGGNIAKSSSVEVKRALDTLIFRLERAAFRISRLNPKMDKDSWSPVLVWSAGRVSGNARYLNPEELSTAAETLYRMFSQDNAHGQSLLDLLKSGFIKIETKEDSACHGSEGPADASASRNGQICFSVERLKNTPFKSLPVETIALAFHELAHVYGFGETEAHTVQNAFLILYESQGLLLSDIQKANYMEYVSYLREAVSDLSESIETFNRLPMEEALTEISNQSRVVQILAKQLLKEVTRFSDAFGESQELSTMKEAADRVQSDIGYFHGDISRGWKPSTEDLKNMREYLMGLQKMYTEASVKAMYDGFTWFFGTNLAPADVERYLESASPLGLESRILIELAPISETDLGSWDPDTLEEKWLDWRKYK